MHSDDARDALSSWRSLMAELGLEWSFDQVAPPPDGRARLLDAVTPIGRFARFASQVAALADVDVAKAQAWLDEVWTGGAWEPAVPGAMAWWVEGGPRAANALRGFVRVSAGTTFARHTHLGVEHLLVIQGRADISTGETLRAGDLVTCAAGVEHAFVVPAGGPDLLLFTVAYEGLAFAEGVARPRD